MFGGQRVSQYFKCSLLKIIDSLSIVDKCLGTNLHLLRFFKSHLPNPFCNPTNNVRTGVSRILTPKFQRCIRCGERICEVFPKRWQYFRRTPKKLQVIMKSQCSPPTPRAQLLNKPFYFFLPSEIQIYKAKKRLWLFSLMISSYFRDTQRLGKTWNS